MPHPDALQLQSYLDGELLDQAREAIRLHIAQCPHCQERVQRCRRLSLALKGVLPTEHMFLSEGKFWLQLASKLPVRRPGTWPLVPYLPPLLLGGVGTLVQVLIYTTLLAYDLTGLRVIPSLGPLVSDTLSSLASHPGLQPWLRARLGWSSTETAQHAIDYWESLHWATQNVLIFVTVLLTLGAFMLVIVVFYSSWAVCWSQSARSDRQKGVSDHGIRSHH